MADTAGEFVMRCFHARTDAHALHLLTDSYAKHVALNEFYSALIPLVDSFAETYQGDYDRLDLSDVPYKPVKDPVQLLTALSDWIATNRGDMCDGDDTYLQNIIDEIVALIYGTVYKLKFLK